KNPKPSAKEHPAKDDACHYYKEVGHCKRNCPAYLAGLSKKKKQVGTASSLGRYEISVLALHKKPQRIKVQYAVSRRHPYALFNIKDEGQELFTSHAWRRLFEIKGPLVREFMLEFFSTCRMSDAELGLDEADTLCFQLGGARRSTRAIPNNRDLRDYWIEVSSDRDFLGTAPYYVYIRDPVRRLCHRMVSYNIFGRGQALEKVTATDLIYLRSMDQVTINVRYLLAQYLFRHAEGRKIGARMLETLYGRLAAHFGLGILWLVDEGAPAIPAPVQAPQPPLAASPTKNLP
ncbi:uncharacterized mitochondrial protein-like protein, partial [Tanacetum coccineum]